MTRPPCIVCGKRRGHDAEAHDKYRHEHRRCANLLRRTWPRLGGLPALLDFYARHDGAAPPLAARPEWTCKVHPDGTITHHPVAVE